MLFFSTLFNHPLGLALGPGDGKIYVANFGTLGLADGGVLEVDPSGTYPTYLVSFISMPNAGTNPKYLHFVQKCTDNGYIEICKLSSTVNPGPAGLCGFTVTGEANTVMVPVGECSGPIPATTPSATITELPVPGAAVSD